MTVISNDNNLTSDDNQSAGVYTQQPVVAHVPK